MDIPRRNWLKLAAALGFGGRMPAGHAADSPKLLERSIPKTGEKIAAVGLGTWQVFDVAGDAAETAQARETLKTFVGLGGRVVDSSPMYGSSESVTGQLAAELGVERPNLIQVHNLVDASTHLATLREWKKAGRVRYLGVTHYHAGAHADLEKIIRPGDIDFVQVNYSLAEPDAGRRLLAAAAESRTAVIVNRPFAEGAMFRRARDKPLPEWATEIGCASWAQYFLKWILAQPSVSCAIPGTRNPRHVADNLAAAQGPLPDEAVRRRMASYFDSL